MTAPDLIAALTAIEQRANRARRDLAAGEAKNGTSALARIEKLAQDAVRHAREEEARHRVPA